MHFAGYSAGSYTAIALEADYRLLSGRFQSPWQMVLPLLERCRAPSSICWSLWYPASVQRSMVTDHRTLRITHVWEDKLCLVIQA